MKNYANILFLFLGVLFSQTDTTLTIYGESNLFIGDSKNPELSWVSPNGAETYDSLDLINLQWSGSDDSFTNESISIYFSQNLGHSFEVIDENITNSENYSFNTPDINSAFARFKITAIDFYGNQSEDLSDRYFTIGTPSSWDSNNAGGQQEVTINIEDESEPFESDSKIPEIAWQYPNGNEEFNQGQSIALSWNGNDDTFNNESISIYYSENLGSPFKVVNENIPMDEIISLTLPNIDSAFGRFKITAVDSYGNTNADKSDMYFILGNPSFQEGGGNSSSLTLNIENDSNDFTGDSKDPEIRWISPNGDDQFNNYELITLEWEASDNSFTNESISIYFSEELGGYYNTIAGNLPNTESYDYTLPEANSLFTRFKISAIDAFGNAAEDYADGYSVVGNPFDDFEVDSYDDLVIVDWQWGEHHTIFIEPSALSSLDAGTELHFIDQDALNSTLCSLEPVSGPVSLAQYTFTGEENELIAVNTSASYRNCNENQIYSWSYMNQGEVPDFIIYDFSENSYHKTIVTGNESFANFKFVNIESLIATDETITPPNSLEYTQSTQQAFYFVIDAEINGASLEPEDKIIAMKNDVVIGIRNWNGTYTDVPVMGNEGSTQKIGYNINNDIFVATVDEQGIPTYFSVDFEQGTGKFGEDITVISGLYLLETSRLETVPRINRNRPADRENYLYNIYRNETLIEENYSSNLYFDYNTQANEDYCYEIYILDLQGAEYIQSANQCASTTTNESLLGDVNYDTAVNVLDVVMVVSYVVGVTNLNTNQINSADMNQDQAVNVLDVVALVNIIVNQ